MTDPLTRQHPKSRWHREETDTGRQSWACIPLTVAIEAALAADTARPGLDVEALAEDVRYADGNGTSDYWRGFNDGIDKLAARLTESRP